MTPLTAKSLTAKISMLPVPAYLSSNRERDHALRDLLRHLLDFLLLVARVEARQVQERELRRRAQRLVLLALLLLQPARVPQRCKPGNRQ